MKIIDEKGRLFAKINIIDFLIILILLSLAPALYFGYKIMTKPAVISDKEYIEIEASFRLIKLEPDILKLISIGDRELDEDGRIIGEIVSLGQSEPYKYEFDIGRNQKIIKKDPIQREIHVRLKMTVEIKEGKPYYKDNEIRFGSIVEFNTSKYSISAIPIGEDIGRGERIIDLNVILKDLDENTLKKISVGDQELSENGTMIAQILSLGKIENSTTKIDLGGGNIVEGQDSSKKQIYARMRLRCQLKGDQLYFRDEKIEYNTPLEFKTNEYTIRGVSAEDYEPYRNEKWFTARLNFKQLNPEIANVVGEGDMEKDEFGKTIAKVDSILSNEPALVVDIFEGKFITLQHPFDRDILALIDLLCVEKEGAYYFKEHMAKMGVELTLNTDLYSITGLITGIRAK